MSKLIQTNLIIILFLFFFLPTTSLAADLFFNADKDNFSLNEKFLVKVYLDTKEVSVNALEGVIKFPPDLLDLKEVRDGNSVINFWVEKPQSKVNGEITFSGITSGGFSGDNKFLFGLIFESKKSGSGSVSFHNIRILQNDGKGTKIAIKEKAFVFNISKISDVSQRIDLEIKDIDPPEDFLPFIGDDPTVFGGKHFLVFSTVDKASGIDHYEILEDPWFLIGDGYSVVESPYVLKDQTLKSKIYIKAIDKAQNERIVEIEVQNKFAYFLQGLIFGIIVTICIFSYVFFRRKIRSRFSR